MIEAAKEITDEKVKFMIVGDGPQEKELQRKIEKLGLKERVKLLCRKKNVARLLRASDMFVLPSKKEAFGLVILEAMVAGLPVVATEAGGVPEIIENGRTGFLVHVRGG